MKSSTLIGFYLWKDTWSRWLEQPGSFLARTIVTLLTVGLATVLLVAFHLLEKGLKERLDAFGLNSIVLNETVLPGQSASSLSRLDRFADLRFMGNWIACKQPFFHAKLSDSTYIPIITFDANALVSMTSLVSRKTPYVLISNTRKPGMVVDFEVDNSFTQAITVAPEPFIAPLVQGETMLMPENSFPEQENRGYVAMTLFQADEKAPPIQKIVSSLQDLIRLDGSTINIRSSISLYHELEELQSNQLRWRFLMAGLIGIVLSLIFGTISLLEFRQNLFISALLRSFGTPNLFLFLRYLFENMVIANMAALLAVVSVAFMHNFLFGSLNFPPTVLAVTKSAYMNKEIALIFLYVNFGALLSSLPIMFALRKPVGEILN